MADPVNHPIASNASRLFGAAGPLEGLRPRHGQAEGGSLTMTAAEVSEALMRLAAAAQEAAAKGAEELIKEAKAGLTEETALRDMALKEDDLRRVMQEIDYALTRGDDAEVRRILMRKAREPGNQVSVALLQGYAAARTNRETYARPQTQAARAAEQAGVAAAKAGLEQAASLAGVQPSAEGGGGP